jgi:hypothetical protein
MDNTNKPVIGVAQVQQMLKDGKTREEIRVHYGINKTNLVLLFKHPDLIGKKTIKQKEPAFTIVENEDTMVASAPAVETIEVVANEVTNKVVDAEGGVDTPIVKAAVEKVGEEAVEEVKVEESKSTWT